jgi:molybdopterin-dependent oxidoreductase-like protein
MRKDGGLVRVSWDEALDAASTLRGVIHAHGPNAVGVYFGSGLGIRLDASGYRLVDTSYKALGAPRSSRR